MNQIPMEIVNQIFRYQRHPVAEIFVKSGGLKAFNKSMIYKHDHTDHSSLYEYNHYSTSKIRMKRLFYSQYYEEMVWNCKGEIVYVVTIGIRNIKNVCYKYTICNRHDLYYYSCLGDLDRYDTRYDMDSLHYQYNTCFPNAKIPRSKRLWRSTLIKKLMSV